MTVIDTLNVSETPVSVCERTVCEVVKESVLSSPSFSSKEINGFKVRAKHYKRTENISLAAALDRISRELGFQNWSQLMKHSYRSEPSKTLSFVNSDVVEKSTVSNLINGIWRPGELLISHPLTGKPIPHTPSGMPLEGVSFKTREEAEKFIYKHWPNGVLMAEVSHQA